MPVLREVLSVEPFFNLTFFSVLPAYLPEEDPQHWAEEEGQEEAAVHQTIFEPSLMSLRALRKNATQYWSSQKTYNVRKNVQQNYIKYSSDCLSFQLTEIQQ